MQALEFWKAVTVDRANLLETVIALLNEHGARYCVIGGQAVNAYAEPVVSLDLDLAIAVEDMGKVDRLFADRFTVKRFPHSLNITMAGSNLRVQLQTDPCYAEFVSRSEVRDVLSLKLPVARVEDVLRQDLGGNGRRTPGQQAAERSGGHRAAHRELSATARTGSR